MPQHDFKPGDRVRNHGYGYVPRGNIGTVLVVDTDRTLCVAWDDFTKGHDGGRLVRGPYGACWWVAPHDLELVESAP